jgi:hypothetical protein
LFQAHYAYSLDAVAWVSSARQTYGYTIDFEGQGSRFFARVERPQLIFQPVNGSDGTKGTPTHLVNGVCAGGSAGGIYDCLQTVGHPLMTWTAVRPLKS